MKKKKLIIFCFIAKKIYTHIKYEFRISNKKNFFFS